MASSGRVLKCEVGEIHSLDWCLVHGKHAVILSRLWSSDGATFAVLHTALPATRSSMRLCPCLSAFSARPVNGHLQKVPTAAYSKNTLTRVQEKFGRPRNKKSQD